MFPAILIQVLLVLLIVGVIAERMEVSDSQVSQIYGDAVKRMRAALR